MSRKLKSHIYTKREPPEVEEFKDVNTILLTERSLREFSYYGNITKQSVSRFINNGIYVDVVIDKNDIIPLRIFFAKVQYNINTGEIRMKHRTDKFWKYVKIQPYILEKLANIRPLNTR